MRRATSAVVLSVLTPVAFVITPAGPSDPRPEAVEPEVFAVDVEGVDPAAAQELGADAAPDLLTAPLGTREFSTLGVSWKRDAALPNDEVSVSVRVRTDGNWTDWQSLDADEAEGPDLVETDAPPLEEAPDAAVVEAAPTAPKNDVTPTVIERVSTEPMWAGPSDGVQVRVDAPGDVLPTEVRAELVDPGESPADASVAQPPAGSAEASSRPAIVSRAQWGADERIRRGAPSYTSTIRAGYVHHTASSNNYTQAQAPALIRSFYAYHVKSLGWSDIGYNFLVDRFGTIYEGRAGGVDRPVLGAHAGGFNSNTFGVGIIGNFQDVAPTAASLNGLQRVMAWKLRMHGVNPHGTTQLRSAGGSSSRFRSGTTVNVRTIAAHRDTNSTACPGNVGFRYMDQIRNGTAAHMNGSYTAAAPQTAIEQAHSRHGGNFGLLGTAQTQELRTADGVGRYVQYQNGVIYWHPSTGAREVHGAVLRTWSWLGNERSSLGYPVTDELSTARNTGRYNRFQHGSIYWSPRTGAHEVRGNIFWKWASLDWERGFLGFPLTSEMRTPNGKGRFNHFQGGSIYWTPQHGAHEVHGAIRERWKRERWERGPLGFPTSDEYTVPGGRASDFEGGRITWNRRTGATTVRLS